MFNTARPQSPNSSPRRLSALAAGIVLATSAPRPATADDLNRIILRVNEEILTLHEYEARKAGEISTILASQLDASQRQERLEQIGQLVVQNSFSEMLLLSFANQQAIRISDSEVQESLQEMMSRQGIESEAQLRQALDASGMTIEQLRENAERELLWQRVVGREVSPKVVITEEELRAYYRNNRDEFRTPEQRWLKEVIVLESSGLEDAELRRIAQEIRQALAAGEEAATAVSPYQEKEISTGMIDLDWLRADELEPSLQKAAWSLSPGAYSEPVAARGGYHIILLAGLREASVQPLADVEDRIRRREYNSRFNRQLQTFLSELEENAYIQEDLPPEAVGYQALAPDYETEDELEIFRAPIEAPAQETDSEEGSGN